ncbi:MAG: aminopeptidase P family protein [Clostridiaceae bacterium]|nr:aminopeptidase P family protein [Clostridiaceae bacterium]
MKLKNLDAALITKRVNYMYLSGFTGTSAILYITHDRAALITDFRYTQQAAAQAPDYEIVRYQGSVYDELNKLLESDNISELSFEDSDLTYSQYTDYTNKLSVRLVPLGRMAEELRIVKEDAELRLIKKSVDIADQVFSHILGFIRPGISELEIAAEIEHHMKRLGAQGPSFETIVASGRRASMPHGVASDKEVQAGDVITMDFGAIYEGYCSDITRTVFLGKPAGEMEKIYNIVLEANLLGLEAVQSGRSGKQIDAVVREFICKAGYGEYFGHGLGHGTGLEIHEDPTLSVRGDMILKDGMVVTVEPGIYLPDLGGVRIEDMVVADGMKARVLTASTKDMIVL